MRPSLPAAVTEKVGLKMIGPLRVTGLDRGRGVPRSNDRRTSAVADPRGPSPCPCTPEPNGSCAPLRGALEPALGTLATVGVRLLPLPAAAGAGLPPGPVSIGAPGGEDEAIGAYLVMGSLADGAVVKPTCSATMKKGLPFH